jgi:hypothetical protein
VLRLAQRYVGAFCLLLCFVFAFFAREESSVFQECTSQQVVKYATQQRIGDTPHVSAPLFERWPISIVCTGDYLNQNNGAINAIATIVIAAFTVILVSVSRKQYSLTRETLVADKRAYVFAIGISPKWEKAENGYNWRIQANWKNTGDTSTRNLRLYAHCDIRNSAIPDNYLFENAVSEGGRGLLAPTQEASGGSAPYRPAAAISPQDIVDVQCGRKFIFLWGWAKYNDVFPGTTEHVTHFCWSITAIGDPLIYDPLANQGESTLTFYWFCANVGNYADEERFE